MQDEFVGPDQGVSTEVTKNGLVAIAIAMTQHISNWKGKVNKWDKPGVE